MNATTQPEAHHVRRSFPFRGQKWACVGTLVLVFLCGALSGGALMTTSGAQRRLHRSVPFWTDAGKQISLERWKNDLHLTPAQSEEISSILEDFAKYYRTVASEAKVRVLRILDDDQKKQFEKMLRDTRN